MTTLRWVYSADTFAASQAVNRYADSVNALSRSMAVNKAAMSDSQVQMIRSAALVAQMRDRVAELDKTLAAQRKLAIDDKGASASLARLQVQASRLQDTLGKENIDSRGAAALEARLLGLEVAAGRLQDKLGGGRGGIGGGIFRLFSGALGGAGSGAISLGAGAGALAGGIAGGAGLGVLAVGATQAAAALAAATAGLGAFAALSFPTIQGLSTALTSLSTVTNAYQAASQNLNIAIHHSPADMKLYQATIHGLEPDLQNAARLLVNQNVVWQNLSPSMQKSVVALYNNKTAYDALLPDQKAALTALLAQKTAWDNLSPAQRMLTTGLHALGSEFRRVSDALAPITFKVFNEGLKVASNLLPTMLPFARSAGNALDGLLKSLAKFTAPAGGTDMLTGKLQAISGLKPPPTRFQQFLAQLQSLSGPAITALGNGLGQIAIAIGKLILAAARPDSIRILGDALAILGHVIDGVSWFITTATGNMVKWIDIAHQTANKFDEFRHDTARVFAAVATIFDDVRHTIASWGAAVGHVFAAVAGFLARGARDAQNWHNLVDAAVNGVVAWFRRLPGEVGHALAGLGSMLLGIGKAALTDFWNGLKSVGSTILGWLGGFLNSIIGIAKKILGVFSPSSVFFDIGRNMMLGLEGGIKAHAHAAVSAARAAAEAAAAAAGTGSGGRILGGVVALGQRMAAARGWTGGQWSALFNLWQGESGWNPAARNPSSGAAGIPQDITGNFHGGAAGQIAWGLAYIAARYGSPAAAYAAWLSRWPHWYGSGLRGGIFDRPTLIGVGERGPERVDVQPVGSRRGHDGPLLHIDNFNSYDATDPVLLGQRLSFAVVTASLGS